MPRIKVESNKQGHTKYQKLKSYAKNYLEDS